jgi:hypothetical protein
VTVTSALRERNHHALRNDFRNDPVPYPSYKPTLPVVPYQPKTAHNPGKPGREG